MWYRKTQQEKKPQYVDFQVALEETWESYQGDDSILFDQKNPQLTRCDFLEKRYMKINHNRIRVNALSPKPPEKSEGRNQGWPAERATEDLWGSGNDFR